ncbi:LysR family transcriptional regulator [Actinoplanes sp. SE50]|uniref:LysR family transcriptional regulator n=1 Tax=unclassified Actinoplanes TaxID=2626549 RepID=UPI00023ECB2A|nr:MULTISPECIES: LysR family transcriptional regulator [unclassified Actinoplanes]AEV84787.1 putative RuBisCO transcriptional regulator [Actinoplanes sp. SE50/110]ATO83179.1 LysR family transcriptional regulator [Actinoplanes sp. SE50]SLM00586.1 LysR-family transcriptional regulator [Actinoplanes sp. SE50/110]
MELRHLRVFDAVARTGTVTDAAVSLGMAPSSVSEQIRALENSLTVSLFERRATGMRLTGDGQRLVGWARQLLDLADRATADMTGQRSDVRLGALETLVATCVPAVLARLAERRPHLRVGIQSSADRLALLTDVDAGRLDAALLLDTGSTLGELGFRPPAASLRFLDLAPVPLTLVTEPHHELQRRPSHPTSLHGQRLLLNAPNCSFALAADKLLGPGPERTFVGSLPTARSWAEQGLGVALLPEFAIADAVRNGTLAVLDFPLPALTLRLVWRADRENTPHVRDLLYAASAYAPERAPGLTRRTAPSSSHQEAIGDGRITR